MAQRNVFLFLFLLFIVNSDVAFGQNYKILLTTSSNNESVKSYNIDTRTDATPSHVAKPNISYVTPQNFIINKNISPLAPQNTGGAVPATIYGQTTTISGSSTISYYYTLTGVAIDANGQIFVADWGTSQIKLIGPAGTPTIYAGTYMPGAANGPRLAASFREPDALLFDNDGNLIISDQSNQLIRKITPAGIVSTLAGSGAMNAVNGPANTAGFNNPRGLTIDQTGNLYVADQGNNLVRKITPGGIVSTYAGTGAIGLTNGAALSATFNTPTAVEIDNNGNLYVSDSENNCVRKITPGGNVSTLATGLNFPRELRVDGTGNIYVVEQRNGRLTRILPNGSVSVVSTALQNPIGMGMDGNGNLFIGDGNYVRKVCISGYTIDKALPPGLTFDQTTGIISGTPASLWPSTDYTITAFNGGGSSSAVVNITVGATAVKRPSVINLPTQVPALDANNNYNPGATSTNDETPITYTSSNPDVAEVLPNGMIHVKKPGQTIITAYQLGNENYYDATPVWQTLTVVEHLFVHLPDIAAKTVCDADFSANGITSQPAVPLTYTSSNPAVATITSAGMIHIIGPGTTTITLAQNGNPPLYVSATPVSKILTVTNPVVGSITITSNNINPCEGSPVMFTASTTNAGNNISYQWKVNGNSAGSNQSTFTSTTLSTADQVTCVYTNLDNSCVSHFPVTSNIIIMQVAKASNPSVTVKASVDYVFPGTEIAFSATVKDADRPVTYSWLVNGIPTAGNSAVLSGSNFNNGDKITCVVKDANLCSSPATSNELTVNIVDRITIPNTFTPNGDGINDTWNISGLISYGQCSVNIYDRRGQCVYRSTGYGLPWDGRVNGNNVAAATYYYVIDLRTNNTPQKRLSGSVTILR